VAGILGCVDLVDLSAGCASSADEGSASRARIAQHSVLRLSQVLTGGVKARRASAQGWRFVCQSSECRVAAQAPGTLEGQQISG
jgi:hypothetical protein